MNSLIYQTFAVVKMNLISLPRRFWMSAAMIFASAVVVAILLAFLSMTLGFETTLKNAGRDDVVIFTRQGSNSELNSSMSLGQVNLLKESPGIVKKEGKAQASAELYVIVDGLKKTTQTEANIPLRGLSENGVQMRQGFKLEQGRMFKTGTNELIVGRGLLREFDGFEPGEEVRFGKVAWRVVGVFSTGGNVFESELWTDAKVIQSMYDRANYFQTLRAQVDPSVNIEAIRSYIDDEPRLNQEVTTEKAFFSAQSKVLSGLAVFGTAISLVMALGAIAGALNTMYSSVADRAQEIATLRALGFSNISAFMGTLIEALVLAALGGVFGVFAAFLLFDGMSASTLGGSFSQVVFNFRFTIDLVVQGLYLSLAIGLLSGFFPAWRAARIPVAVAFQVGR